LPEEVPVEQLDVTDLVDFTRQLDVLPHMVNRPRRINPNLFQGVLDLFLRHLLRWDTVGCGLLGCRPLELFFLLVLEVVVHFFILLNSLLVGLGDCCRFLLLLLPGFIRVIPLVWRQVHFRVFTGAPM